MPNGIEADLIIDCIANNGNHIVFFSVFKITPVFSFKSFDVDVLFNNCDSMIQIYLLFCFMQKNDVNHMK